jgi:hypothetical protein
MTEKNNIYQMKFRQDFNKIYKMVTPEERYILMKNVIKNI